VIQNECYRRQKPGEKFHGQTVLHGIDLEVEQGEVVAIIGPSGSGKRRCCAVLTCLNSRKAAPFG
jgi:cystine transport system ATP-binding protein